MKFDYVYQIQYHDGTTKTVVSPNNPHEAGSMSEALVNLGNRLREFDARQFDDRIIKVEVHTLNET